MCDVQAKFSEARITEEVPPLPPDSTRHGPKEVRQAEARACASLVYNGETAANGLTVAGGIGEGCTVGTSEQKRWRCTGFCETP